MSSYTLDFPTIMVIFHDQKRTGELRTESVRLRGKGIFRARITFYNGKDLSCVLEYPTGQFYVDGENARQLLARAGVLEWDWIAKSTTNPAVQVSVRTTRLRELDIVFRRSQGSLNGLSLLPRPYQHLMLLVDGERTVEQIAAFFPGTSVQEVYGILVELHKQGWLIL